MSKEISDQVELDVTELHGLLISYKDDQLNKRIKESFQNKNRVKLNCMDIFSDFLAFGTSSGAIYLYKLDIPYHSTCELKLIWPCDQGPIEIIKFLPELENSNDLLIAIGTTKGSIVVLKISSNDITLSLDEIYKERLSSDQECGVKIIEANNPFSKLYICDEQNTLYVLDLDTIYSKNTFKAFVKSRKPSLLYGVKDSKINQISVYGSHLLISTGETTRFFDEQSTGPKIIGKQPRKEGFYGACFFSDPENVSIFVARPDFRLWQVDYSDELKVVSTFPFKSIIKRYSYPDFINLENKPLEEDGLDNPSSVINPFIDATIIKQQKDIGDNHFEKIIPIFSKTLGNLLLSHTEHDIFVINPITAQLIVCYSQNIPIKQVCCNEKEIFIWSYYDYKGQRIFELKRLVLLSPVQFVIELHRLNRFPTLIEFVQLFSDVFKSRMALPIHGPDIIKVDGGLLRNILINAWSVYKNKAAADGNNGSELAIDDKYKEFESMIEAILNESRQLKQSLENLTDSRFFIPISNENLERITSEPFLSFVALQINLKDLHPSGVIHFTRDALTRHRSVMNLSQNIRNLQRNPNISVQSNINLNTQPLEKDNSGLNKAIDNKVIVERRKLKRISKLQINEPFRAKELTNLTNSINKVYGSSKAYHESQPCLKINENQHQRQNSTILPNIDTTGEEEEEEGEASERQVEIEKQAELEEEMLRCKSCQWPKPRIHLKNLNTTQQIQLKWIKTNLEENFEENVGQIKELSFKHGLWKKFLECLAFSNELDDYITCCMMLDDIRLLDDRIVITRGEDKVVDKFLTHLSRKINSTNQGRYICFKCGSEPESIVDEQNSVHQPHQEDELSFTLVNLFENFMLRPNADRKMIIKCLMNSREFLNDSKIPATFYLKVIAFAVLAANQSPLSRIRLNQLRGTSASPFL